MAHGTDGEGNDEAVKLFLRRRRCTLHGDGASCRTLHKGVQNGHGGPGESEDDACTQHMYKAAFDDRGE